MVANPYDAYWQERYGDPNQVSAGNAVSLTVDASMCHTCIMRTTINVPDYLLLEAKKLATVKRVPLTAIFEESLRLYLAEQKVHRATPTGWSLPMCDAGIPVPGVNLNDTSQLMEF
ncbi:MAG: hypothetical protein AB1758_04620 [Candidatus Eremiobacterota bacterium]